jgi:hypothetical protein
MTIAARTETVLLVLRNRMFASGLRKFSGQDPTFTNQERHSVPNRLMRGKKNQLRNQPKRS